MADVKLGNNTYAGVNAVKMDTTDGNTVLFVPEPVLEELTVTENGEYTPPDGVDGFSKVVAEIPDYFVMKITNQPLAEYKNESITELAYSALQGWSNLKRVDLPNLITIGRYAFQSVGCAEYDFPKARTVGDYAFSWASLLKAKFHCVTSIGSGAFEYANNMTALIIQTDSVCTLTGANAFSNTPIAKGTGYIYVPATLVDSYKTATNWSTYADQIRAIEDYPDITGG